MAGSPKKRRRRPILEAKLRQALELRTRGMTYTDIAKELGYQNGSGVRALILRELKRRARKTNDTLDEIRQLELERLDGLLRGAFIRAAGDPTSSNPEDRVGDPEHAKSVLRIMERRAKLLGLDSPVKKELTGRGGAPLYPKNVDFSKLSVEQLDALEELLTQASVDSPPPLSKEEDDEMQLEVEDEEDEDDE